MKLIIAIIICAGIYWWWTSSDSTPTPIETPIVDTIQVDTISTKQKFKSDVKQLGNSTVDVAGDIITAVKDMIK